MRYNTIKILNQELNTKLHFEIHGYRVIIFHLSLQLNDVIPFQDASPRYRIREVDTRLYINCFFSLRKSR